jgi:hypothetical protein
MVVSLAGESVYSVGVRRGVAKVMEYRAISAVLVRGFVPKGAIRVKSVSH